MFKAATKAFFVDIVARGYSEAPARPQTVVLYAAGRRKSASDVAPVGFFTYRFKVPAGWVQPGQAVQYAIEIPRARPTVEDPQARGIVAQQIWIRQ